MSNKFNNTLNEMLELAGLNEDRDSENISWEESGYPGKKDRKRQSKVSKSRIGIKSQEEYKKVPAIVKDMYFKYMSSGGHKYDNVWEFVEDMAQFIRAKGFDGGHIARWDKEKNPASGT